MLFLLVIQQCRDPLCGLLYEAGVIPDDCVDGADRALKLQGQLHDADAPVLADLEVHRLDQASRWFSRH